MIIPDTSVFIEYFRRGEPYYSWLAKLMDGNRVMAMAGVFGELLQGAKNQKEQATILEYWRHLPKFPEQDLLINAGLESGKNRWSSRGLSLIDAAIIIHARETQSQVWTLDKKLLKELREEERFQE
jgi:predicted nucleic acid-binding protein